MIKGQGYDSKWDFITNTKCKFINELSLMFIIDYVLAFYYSYYKVVFWKSIHLEVALELISDI